MKPFDFNKYIKNNPLLKEGKLENEMYNALQNFDTNSDKGRISALETILNNVLTPEQKQMSNQIIQDAKKKTAKNKERPESFAYYAMHDIADDPEYYNPLGLSKQQFNQVINVLWGEPIGVGAGEPSGDVTDQLQSLGYTVDEYETADAIGVAVKNGAKTLAKSEFDNTDPENQEDIQDFLKDFLAKVSKVKR